MDAINGRAPERERDERGMPAGTETLAACGGATPYRTIRPQATVTPHVDAAEPTTMLVPARHHPGFIVLFKADDGKFYAGRVPETCPVEAMAHARRAFRSVPSVRDPERRAPSGQGPGCRSVPEGVSTDPRGPRAGSRAGD